MGRLEADGQLTRTAVRQAACSSLGEPPYGAPVALQPVREVISGVHILSDLTLGLGTIVHDYLAANQELK